MSFPPRAVASIIAITTVVFCFASAALFVFQTTTSTKLSDEVSRFVATPISPKFAKHGEKNRNHGHQKRKEKSKRSQASLSNPCGTMNSGGEPREVIERANAPQELNGCSGEPSERSESGGAPSGNAFAHIANIMGTAGIKDFAVIVSGLLSISFREGHGAGDELLARYGARVEKIVRSVMEGYKLITTAPEGEIEARFKRLSKRVKRVMLAVILKDFHDLLKVRLHFSKNAHAVQYIHRASFAVLGMKGTSKTLELEILVAVQAYHRYRGPALARKIVSNMKICDGARLGLAGVLPASFIPPASSAFPSATLPCTSYSSRMSRAAVV